MEVDDESDISQPLELSQANPNDESRIIKVWNLSELTLNIFGLSITSPPNLNVIDWENTFPPSDEYLRFAAMNAYLPLRLFFTLSRFIPPIYDINNPQLHTDPHFFDFAASTVLSDENEEKSLSHAQVAMKNQIFALLKPKSYFSGIIRNAYEIFISFFLFAPPTHQKN